MEAKIYALVVGINKYGDDERFLPLSKAADGARRFVEWLVEYNVPPENITLFTSEKNGTHNDSSIISKNIANRDSIGKWIDSEIVNCLSSSDDLLYVFWNGHGFSTEEPIGRAKRLTLADATEHEHRNLHLTSLIDYLSVSCRFTKQFFFINSCASELSNPKELRSINNGATTLFYRKESSHECFADQFVFHSSVDFESVKGDEASDLIISQLKEQSPQDLFSEKFANDFASNLCKKLESNLSNCYPGLSTQIAGLKRDWLKRQQNPVRRDRDEQNIFIPKPPLLSIYNSQTWVGRKAIIDECLPKLQGQVRVLWITGISGIGKTTLGECFASQSWGREPSFQWLCMEILEGQSPAFVSVAAELLTKLGDVDLDPQERNDPKRLIERLLQKLKNSRYWLQVDSLERLLSSEQPTETEFSDHHWVTFLQRCLTEPSFLSRLVLTAQALPNSLAELEERYPNFWQAITLQGLLANQLDAPQPNEHLVLFAKNGLSVDDSSASHLQRIGQIYEGHPLVLQVIAKEILAAPFAGKVAIYWERYGNEFEQVARELKVERVSPELYNQALQKRVCRRVERSLKRLPLDALELLCRSSVYRRPVLETFWLSLIEEQTSQRRQQAYQILNERALVEREGIHQNQFLIRQHNLVRAVAYDLLKADPKKWQQSERQAAHLWLTAYAPTSDATNLETVRGYLEAVDHYYEVGEWEVAKDILLMPIGSFSKVHILRQLEFWSLYQEGIRVCQKILKKSALDTDADAICLRMLGNYYLRLGSYPKALDYYEQSLTIAREIGDRQSEGLVLGNLGITYYRLGQYERAIDLCRQHLTIAREIGDRQGEGYALGNLGNAYKNLGQYERAIDLYQQHLTISREIGDCRSEGNTLNNLGIAYDNLGQYEQAIDLYQQRLTIAREIGDRQGEGNALGNLGITYKNLGQYERAIDLYQQQLTIAREIGDRRGTGDALGNLGSTYKNLGQYERAIDLYQQYLTIAREIGDHWGEGYALCGLGVTQLKLEQYPESLTNTQTALEIFQEIGGRNGEAEALKNLTELHQALGEGEVARQYCQQALGLATELGIPLAEECQKLMEELKEWGASERK